MIKNKKLIALLCALSMIFSVFASFTVVNAEETKGITLEYVAAESTDTQKVIVAKYAGFESGISAFGITIQLPEGATATSTEMAGMMIDTNTSADNKYIIGGMATKNITAENNEITKITITLAAASTEPFDIELLTGSSVAEVGQTGLSVALGTMPASKVTVPVWTDPSATPTPTPVAPIATRAPRPTADPSASTAPTKEPVVVDKGIALVYDKASSTDTEKVVVAKYVGFENGISAFGITIQLPEGATAASTEMAGMMIDTNTSADNKYIIGGMATKNITAENNEITKITITLTAPLEEDLIVELLTGSTVAEVGQTGLSVALGTMPAAWTTIPAAGEPTPTTTPKDPVGTVSLPEVKITVDDIPADAATSDNIYIAVKVTKKDGTNGVYGTDYVATIGDKTLTKEELSNVLNGYFDLVDGVDNWNDVVNKLKFNVFNEGTTVAAQLVKETAAGGTVIAGGEKTVGTTKPTATPKAPTLAVSASKTSVTVGTLVTVTATVSTPEEEYELAFDLTKGSLSDVAGWSVEGNKVSFKPAAKGTYEVSVTYSDGKNADITKTATIKVTESPAPNNGGGSSSSGSGSGGPIAGPSGSLTPTGGTTIGGTSFNDIGDVAWAQEAIYALASKGIINGRDEYTFDPNANITRAEYCQILIGAIGKSSEYADSSFADVPTDAWFYHAVAVASQYGIVSGYGDGNFGPYDLITRQDMALMTLKAAQVMNKNLVAATESSFTDADQISDYAQEAVYTLANAGIINGMGDGTFAPIANATRAQAAVIIYSTFVK